MRGLAHLKTRRKVVWITLGIVVLFGAILVHGVHRVDPQKIDRQIREGLPVGSDATEVIRFLDSNHIAHFEYVPQFRQLGAFIPNSTIGLTKSQIYVDFRFDENGKLLRYEVHELFEVL
jgi:hypothetical protein